MPEPMMTKLVVGILAVGALASWAIVLATPGVPT